jgi:hypothetical protein
MIQGMQRRQKYGLMFPQKWTNLDIALHCFKIGRTKEQGGLGQAGHFWEIVAYLWGVNNPVHNTSKYFIKNPWSEDIVDELCSYKYVAVGGASGSTKSETAALWLLVKYLSNARRTLGFAISTSLKEAKQRIWGSAVDFVHAIPKGVLPLEAMATGIIRYNSPTFKAGERACLCLIAGERKQEKEAIGKLIGKHQDEVIVVADELTELPESIIEYALPGGNLSSNPKYQVIGLANPASYYDSFARIWKPKAGWTSITVEDTRWETEYGIALHLDGMKSPNIPEVIYKAPNTGLSFLPTQEKIDAALASEGGANSLRFWRMIRGFPSPMGQADLIYSQVDIVKFKGDEPAVWGDSPLIRIAALDPGFTNGGDRSILYFGTLGQDKEGKKVLQFDEYLELTEDVTNTKEERSFQIARQLKEQCEKRDIPPYNCGVDNTGAGNPFCDVVATVWSPLILRVNFGGSASEFPVSLTDSTPAKEKYHDRVSEIWYSGRELLRQSQLKGICPAMAQEMVIRMYGTTGAKKRIFAESKTDMKFRTHRSPDIADAGFILVTLARERFGFTMKIAPDSNLKKVVRSWRELCRLRNPKLARPSALSRIRVGAHPEV